MLNHLEIDSIRGTFPPDAPANESMVVLDLRQSDWLIHHVFFRNWVQSGEICRTDPFELDQLDELLSQVQGKRPIVMIGDQGLNRSAAWLGKIAEGDWFTKLDWPMEKSTRATALPATHFAAAKFSIEGLDSLALTSQQLPVRLSVRLGADGFKNFISIRRRPGQSGLPAEQWFKLAASFGSVNDRYPITLDIIPGHSRDVWQLTGDQIQVTEIANPQVALPAHSSLDALTLVFDRTCPQSGVWSEAKRLLLKTDLPSKRAQEPLIGGGPTFGATEADPVENAPRVHPKDFNRVIRERVASELKEFANQHHCSINGIWFADDPSDLSWPLGTGLTPPTAVGEWKADISSDDLDEHFQQYTYTLGFDIWDALDLALKDVAKYLESGGAHHNGVLIVGNSPPPPPTDPKSAYWRILKADPSRPVDQLFNAAFTSTHRRTARFTELVQDLAKKGIACAYVFLEHNSPENPDDENAFSFFKKIQQLVIDALRESLPVFVCSATSEGTRKGMKRAFDYLSDFSKSAVRVEQEKS